MASFRPCSAIEAGFGEFSLSFDWDGTFCVCGHTGRWRSPGDANVCGCRLYRSLPAETRGSAACGSKGVFAGADSAIIVGGVDCGAMVTRGIYEFGAGCEPD